MTARITLPVRRTFKQIAYAVLAVTATAAQSGRAESFDPTVVGSKAKFVAFIDFDHARKTAVGKTIMDYVRENPRYAEIEAQLLEHVGLMPLADVQDVTLWGEEHAKEPKAVLVVRAKFNPKSLRFAAGFTPGFDVENHAGHELLSWVDENKPGTRVYACIFGDEFVLFGGDKQTVKRGVDVLSDTKQSLQPETKMPAPSDELTWAFAAVIDFAKTPDALNNPVASQLHDAMIELCETNDDKAALRMTGTALTEEAAPKMFRMAGGALMLAQWVADRAAKPQTTRPDGTTDPRAEIAAMVPGLLRATGVRNDGRKVFVDLAISNDTAITLLKKMAAVREADLDADGVKK